jgi:hypothetical protein
MRRQLSNSNSNATLSGGSGNLFSSIFGFKLEENRRSPE